MEFYFDSPRKAKVRLEWIANCFSTSSPAVGEVWFRNDYVNRTTCYEITYKERAVLVYKGSKKEFLNSQ